MVTSGLDADDEAGYGSGSDDEAEILAAERPLLESGAAERSGKMLVLKQLLPKWFKGGHKALIFCQTRGMLSIIEAWVRERGWRYSRLDGNTPVGTRQPMIDAFNSDPATFLMLATTRTGGVGVNLTGANRVVLFDPDWNPCTDAQARERAWRLGQTSPVTVYRLICAGTIEEKIYQRQVFKTSQAGAVLSRDPRHARQKGKQFSRSEMHDLFSLGDDDCPDDIDALGEELDLGEVDESLQECRDTAAEEPPGSEDGEKNVLKALFNSSQLSGVFSHAQTTEDVAATTAAEAAAQAEVDEAVRQLCRSAGDGRLGFEPTWTGRSGAAPRFGATRAPARGSAGMGSASLLDRIRSRSSLNAPPAVIGAAEGSHPLSNAADRALILRLEAFFANGRAHATKDVLSSFSDVPDSQAVTFRRHLKAVAKCQNGLWKARVAIS
jgi:DNA excision repair protein ERCC-6